MLEFTKMSGCGNDFIVVDNRNGAVPEPEIADFARQTCPRGLAVGADGVLLLEECQTEDFRFRIINADGSEAEMCGNGARCLAAYAHQLGIASETMRMQTLAGPVEAAITASGVRVRLPDCVAPVKHADLLFADYTADIWFTVAGVPHAVMPVDNLENANVREWGRALRFHQAFAPAGANANFIQRESGGIAIRTYERGVEDETLACGTGSTASAMVAAEIWGMDAPIQVRTRCGETLTIHFQRDGTHYRNVCLEGPVRFVYTATLAGQ